MCAQNIEYVRIRTHLNTALKPQLFFDTKYLAPHDVIERIIGLLNKQDLLSLSLVSRTWCFVIAQWRTHKVTSHNESAHQHVP